MSTSTRPQPSAWDYVLCYALWLVTSAVALFDANIVWLWVREGYILMQFFRWGFAATYEFSLVILGLIWLIVVIALEYYFRRWVVKGVLWKRFRVVAAIALVPVVLRFISTIL